MKTIYLLFLILLTIGIIFSCKSPVESEKSRPVEPTNEPPFVMISGNINEMRTGDTLRLRIKASDTTLISGSVDFRDGSVISFDNLNYVLDTTVSHVYSSIGSYNIQASFSDSKLITTKNDSVIVYLNNQIPVLIIKPSSLNLNLGDTVKVTVHVFDDLPTYGYITFYENDSRYSGAMFSFYNLPRVFDTTVSYVFKSIGSNMCYVWFQNTVKENYHSFYIMVNGTSPIVNITPNKTSLNIGDTLKVVIHASDRTLSDGSIDFKDGTIVSFQNLNKIFDTTITHIYSKAGKFDITANFFNIGSSTTTSCTVAIYRYYALKLTVGMEWQYSYSYSYFFYPTSNNESGTKNWRIISSSIANNDTIYTIQQIKSIANNTIIDTSQFNIIFSNSHIIVNMPTKRGTETYTLNNYTSVDIYPISNGALKIDDNGVYSYYYLNSGYHFEETENLTLINFSRP